MKASAKAAAHHAAHQAGHHAHEIFIGASAAIIEGKWIYAAIIAAGVVIILVAQAIMAGEG